MAKILVVDDDPSIRRALCRLFESKGYAVASAIDGVDAWEKVHAEKPDVMLLDISMPRMDGLELLGRLSESAYKPAVLMITALGDVDLAKKAVGLGAWDYLLKPFDINYVEQSVDAKLRSLGR